MLLHNLKKLLMNIYSCNYAKRSRGSMASSKSQKGCSAHEVVDTQSCEPVSLTLSFLKSMSNTPQATLPLLGPHL